MFDLDKWQEILATIKKNKLRTILTALSVFWGIFMLIFMLGVGKGLENGVRKGFGQHAKNSCYMWGMKTQKPYNGLKAGRWIRFTYEDMDAIRSQVEGVESLAPQLRRNNEITRYGNNSGAFQIKGDVPEYQEINPMNITKGRFINQKDIKEKRKVAVIGERVLDILFDDKIDAIGEFIKIRGVYFQVVGIAKSFRKNDDGEEDEKSIYVPITTMQTAYNMGNRVGYLSFTAKNGVSVSSIEDQAKELLMHRHKVDPTDKTAIGSANLEEEFNKVQGLFTGINGLIWFVGICTIIAGIVGVSNIMLIIVKERTREIGLKKALGAKPISIILQIIQESIFITTSSGYFGLIIGVGIIELLRKGLSMAKMEGGMFSDPRVDFSVAVSATIFLIIAGGFAGFFPARKAASVSPVEALRDE